MSKKLLKLGLATAISLGALTACKNGNKVSSSETNIQYSQPQKVYQTNEKEDIYQDFFKNYANYYEQAPFINYVINFKEKNTIYASNKLTDCEKESLTFAVNYMNQYFSKIYPDYSLSYTYVEDVGKFSDSFNSVTISAQPTAPENSSAFMSTSFVNKAPHITIFRDTTKAHDKTENGKTINYVERCAFVHEMMHCYGWDHTQNYEDVLYSKTEKYNTNPKFSSAETKFFIRQYSPLKDYKQKFDLYNSVMGNNNVDEIVSKLKSNMKWNEKFDYINTLKPNQIISMKFGDDCVITLNKDYVNTYTYTQKNCTNTGIYDLIELDENVDFPTRQILVLHDFKTVENRFGNLVWSNPFTLAGYSCNYHGKNLDDNQGYYEWKFGDYYFDDVTDEYIKENGLNVQQQAKKSQQKLQNNLDDEFVL
ncbi:MAG: hypothetical protein ACI4TZ_02395 [Christensenellales bacterium]